MRSSGGRGARVNAVRLRSSQPDLQKFRIMINFDVSFDYLVNYFDEIYGACFLLMLEIIV